MKGKLMMGDRQRLTGMMGIKEIKTPKLFEYTIPVSTGSFVGKQK